ncbi:uncharacterized protein LOC115973189 [Quercus lobata]|uniref:uncharacterized protein LOC115973189 n=1 Tax=Quercus lobata TaxID=97700 RepID=UPI00124838D8|nr:uncharacterized protein LOC115973189 [Quercus lobata]
MQNPSERGLDERMDPNGKTGSIMKPGDMSVIYVCELPEIKEKFDLAKAMSLGLKPGPKYCELQLGNSVKSDHQNITQLLQLSQSLRFLKNNGQATEKRTQSGGLHNQLYYLISIFQCTVWKLKIGKLSNDIFSI